MGRSGEAAGIYGGRADPDMVKRAVAIQVKVDPPAPKPGEPMKVALTLTNAGAGHIPTGDPDRHFTVEFAVKDGRSWLKHVIPWGVGLCGNRPSWVCTITACSPLAAGSMHLSIECRRP